MSLPDEYAQAIVRMDALMCAIIRGEGVGRRVAKRLRYAAIKAVRHAPSSVTVAEAFKQDWEALERHKQAWLKEYTEPSQ